MSQATKPFELYITVSPQLSKSAVVAAANNVAKWVLAEEGRIFLKDAPVFWYRNDDKMQNNNCGGPCKSKSGFLKVYYRLLTAQEFT